MPQTIQNKIQRGFSTSAGRYDLSAGLHRKIADKLLAQIIKEPRPSVLLDVGCGTGYLTGQAKYYFLGSEVIGLDFAEGMLKAARHKHENISWVLGDINNLPFSDAIVDMLISNLAYQWAGDLNRSFTEGLRVLAPKGILACTLFGYHTCQELFQSLGEAKPGTLKFNRLPDKRQVTQALLKNGFQNPTVNNEFIKVKFKDMHELMGWLKSIGADNLPREGYLGKEAMARAAAIYREQFPYDGGVQATFEVIWIYVKK